MQRLKRSLAGLLACALMASNFSVAFAEAAPGTADAPVTEAAEQLADEQADPAPANPAPAQEPAEAPAPADPAPEAPADAGENLQAETPADRQEPAAEPTATPEDAQTAVALAGGDVVFTIQWNDNKDGEGKRPEANTTGVGNYFELQVEESGSFVPATGVSLNKVEDGDSSHGETIGTWHCTYSGLESEKTYKLVAKSELKNYVSDWREAAGAEEAMLTMTVTTPFEITKSWQDNNNTYTTRPDDAAWLSTATLYRVNMKDKTEESFNLDSDTLPDGIVENIGKTDLVNWKVSIENLRAYEPGGVQYNYYLKQGTQKIVNTSSEYAKDYYKTEYNNNDPLYPEIDRVYSGGTIKDTLSGNTLYSITKKWVDGNRTSSQRPTAKLDFYRTPESNPNYGAYMQPDTPKSLDIPNTSNEVVITSPAMPKYDAEGSKYIYYGVEALSGNTGDYVKEVERTAFDGTHLLNGDVLTNRLKANKSVDATKTFVAKAMEGDFDSAEVTMAMKDGDGTVQASEDLDEFRAEKKSQTAHLDTVPKYDDEGNELRYTGEETALLINSKTGEALADPKTDNYIENKADNATSAWKVDEAAPLGTTAYFNVIPDNAEHTSITNKLVGLTQVKVIKKWMKMEGGTAVPEEESAHEGASVEFTLLRDGVQYAGKTLTLTQTDAEASDPSTWIGYFKDLPRYDAQGREYKYEVQEGAITGLAQGEAEKYLSTLEYDKHAIDHTAEDGKADKITEVETTITNTRGVGEALTFDVYKQWLDDGDVSTRSEVKAVLYNTKIGQAVDSVNILLTDQNHWHQRVRIPAGGYTIDDFVVYETELTETNVVTDPNNAKVVYSGQDHLKLSNYTTGTGYKESDPIPTQFGMVENDRQKYNVYLYHTKFDDNNATFTLVNQRHGKETMRLEKKWVVGSETRPEALTATFQLRRWTENTAVEDIGSPFDLKLETTQDTSDTTNWVWESISQQDTQTLEKYDVMGRLYTYSFLETELNGEAYQNNAVRVNDEQYVAGMKQTKEEYSDKHDNDRFEWLSTNTRSATQALNAYKIWRDDGSGERPFDEVNRAGIYFNLYRTTMTKTELNVELNGTTLADLAATAGSGVAKVPVQPKQTKENDWAITINLGNQARYDAYGDRYLYLLTEDYSANVDNIYHTLYYDINQNAEYAAGNKTGGDFRDFKATDTKGTFDVPTKDIAASQYLTINDGTGKNFYSRTILNYREANWKVSGKKVWQNLVNQYPAASLPDVELTLYKSDNKDYLTDTTHSGTEQISKITAKYAENNYNFAFKGSKGNEDFPRYDEWGHVFYYTIAETQIDGYELKQYTNTFTFDNTYQWKGDNDGTQPCVEITLNKTWDVDMDPWDASKISSAEFTLHGVDSEKNDVVLQTKTIAPPQNEGTTKTTTYVFGDVDNGDGCMIPYYAPNGKPFDHYYLVESVPDGYLAKTGNDQMQGDGGGKTLKSANITVQDANKKNSKNQKVYSNTTGTDTGMDFSNEYDRVEISVVVNKSWTDSTNAFNVRPTEVSFKLQRWVASAPTNVQTVQDTSGNDLVKTAHDDGTGKWSCTFETMDKYDPHSELYIYQAVEIASAGQELADSFYTNAQTTSPSADTNGNITMGYTNTLQTTSLTVKKDWATSTAGVSSTSTSLTGDALIKQLWSMGAFPESVTFTVWYKDDDGDWKELQNQGVAVSQKADLSTTVYTDFKSNFDNLKTTGLVFTNLPKSDKRQYCVKETLAYKAGTTGAAFTNNATENKSVMSKDANPTIEITNVMELTKLNVSKAWADDRDDYYGKRPATTTEIEVKLMRGTEANGTTTWQEVKDPTNTTKPLTAMLKYDSTTAKAWVATFENLPKTYVDSTGTSHDYKYAALETNPDGIGTTTGIDSYLGNTAPVAGTNDPTESEYTINGGVTNTLQTITISGTKSWSDQGNQQHTRPGSIQLTVKYKDASGAYVALNPQPAAGDITWSGWDYTIKGLPMYQKAASGKTPVKYEYAIEEGSSSGYTPALKLVPVDLDAKVTTSPYHGTASFTNYLGTGDLMIVKVWDDAGNGYKTRPEDLQVIVNDKSGRPLPTQPKITWEKNDDNTWVCKIETLPTAGGRAIGSVTEILPDGYTATVDTVDIVNKVATLTNSLETVELTGTKTWVDESDRFGNRPDTLTLTASNQNGALAQQPGITWVKSGDTWTYTATGLPKYLPGTKTEAVYTLTETEPYGYKADQAAVRVVNGKADFTNSLQPVTLEITKNWKDTQNAFGTRPDALQLSIANQEGTLDPQPAITLVQGDAHTDTWLYRVEGLPAYLNGNTPAVYTITETVPEGYTAASKSVTASPEGKAELTNTYDGVELAVTKTWNDTNNHFGTRPDGLSLTVLTQNGPLDPQPSVSWTKNGNVWKATVGGLPKYLPGTTTAAVYAVKETAPAGYTPRQGTVDAKNGQVSLVNDLTWAGGSGNITKHAETLTGPGLEGAVYRLQRLKTDLRTVEFYTGTVNGVSQWSDDVSAAKPLVTDKDGRVSVIGLHYGVYAYVETTPPAGYKLRTDSVLFTLDAKNPGPAEVNQADEPDIDPNDPNNPNRPGGVVPTPGPVGPVDPDKPGTTPQPGTTPNPGATPSPTPYDPNANPLDPNRPNTPGTPGSPDGGNGGDDGGTDGGNPSQPGTPGGADSAAAAAAAAQAAGKPGYKGPIAQTGDSMNLVLIWVLLGVSGAAIVVLAFVWRRRKRSGR